MVTPSSGLIHKEDTILDATASYVNNANKIKRTQTNNFFESYVSMPTRKTSLGFDSPVKR